ncbi:MAG: hypothetical protein ACRD8Z_00605 [Nitrososphaeraceae archaeon]
MSLEKEEEQEKQRKEAYIKNVINEWDRAHNALQSDTSRKQSRLKPESEYWNLAQGSDSQNKSNE